ncbi:hypothetical protein PYCCODRAFT_1470817 [Trametes coccinea BRFM310]|uniref:Ribosomal RNA-processing protein 8 n=1 Tax=Trametes coccinea (strain BRFM310) TaxID=1353009 RepID=A0A1Y2IE69_TRAC3|nr:hypothetical protein PYCCODRAFT_1470817 [Trametes coccinea BRFM310]
MSLFEVPGWTVPGAPVSQPNKKRKRPAAKDTPKEVDEAQMIKSAQKNIEKLMQSLGAGIADLDGEDDAPPNKKSRPAKDKKEKKGKGAATEPERGRKAEREGKNDAKQRAVSDEKSGDKQAKAEQSKDRSKERPVNSQPKPEAKQERKEKQKQKQKQKKDRKRSQSADTRTDAAAVPDGAVQASPPKKNAQNATKKSAANPYDPSKSAALTPLQANMKKSLDGARFRWINEMLYKSDSAKARELMSSDPAVFVDYHTGFRHQVESWPTNPVSHYISVLSSYPVKTVIADLGCGDATLARTLVPKGMTVLSFDLVSDGAYVIEADICSRVPLPGSESVAAESADDEEETGEGQVVDVVVCALSLMGTNWPSCIREAWRILKADGELKVAEVASRLSSIDDFSSFVSSFGFKLKSKDDRNSHFTLFEFKKVPRKPKTEKEWKKLMSRGNILKPCEYKRR